MPGETTTSDRRAALLRHPDISAWIKDHSKAGTASVHIDHLELFLRRTGLDPDRLASLARKDPKRLKAVTNDYLRGEQAKGRKAKYVVNVWWSVRSYLKSIGSAPDWNPKVEPSDADEEDEGRVVPTHAQLREIVHAAKSARDRAAILILASSGIRVGALATQFAPVDGLRLKHLIDLRLSPEPHFEKLPPMVRVPAHLSKGKSAYYTGFTSQASDAVVAYLKERSHRGEKLTPESPLVHPDARGRRASRTAKDGAVFMVRKSLAARVRAAMDRVAPKGVRWTTHTLRAWCSTQLESCESKGLIGRTRRELYLGHSLGIDGAYNLARPLTPEKVEELRASYAKCAPFLSTDAARGSSNTEAFRVLLSVWYTDEEIGKIDLDDTAAVIEALRKGAAKGAAPKQQVIPESELPRYLAEGWVARIPVNGSKFVIERS